MTAALFDIPMPHVTREQVKPFRRMGWTMTNAVAGAKAKAFRDAHGWEIHWEDDWHIGSHIREYGREVYDREPDTCESAVIYDADGSIITAIGCNDDMRDNDRADVESDLTYLAIQLTYGG